MSLGYYQTTLNGNCGVGLFYGFNSLGNDNFHIAPRTGLFIAGFINNNVCKNAYKELCSKFKVVYQSPLCASQDGNPKGYFLCVFDSK